MNRTQRLRIATLYARLQRLGIMPADCDALYRLQMQLHRWHELECGVDAAGGRDTYYVERDEETGKCFGVFANSGRRHPISDRETGALKRLKRLISQYPGLAAYVQTDPRGCALYVGAVENMTPELYTRGVAVCV